MEVATGYDTGLSSDRFTAYLETYRASPLVISFLTRDDFSGGSPLGVGLEVIEGDPTTSGVNLHQPKWAATLIRQRLERGWKPELQTQEFIIQNGVELLELLDYTATG